MSNSSRERRAARDDSAADAVRGAGVVVGLSLAAVAVLFAVRRWSGASGDSWRRRDERDESRSRSANQPAPAVVSSSATPGLRSESFARESTLAIEEELIQDEEADDGGEALPAGVVQLTTRRRLPGGQEAIEQFVRCKFADSDPLSVVHVAFCPPLMTKPTVEVDQLEGTEATIKTTLAEAFGTRLEVRLAKPAEQVAAVVLRIYAVG